MSEEIKDPTNNSSDKPYIVWIEDDNFLGGLISKKLTAEGFEVAYVSSGEEAIDKIKEQEPDVILSDVLLPGMNGFEILEQVKADPDLKDIPVILFSNLSQESDINRGLELGAESFLVKSNVVPNQIIAKIKDLLK